MKSFILACLLSLSLTACATTQSLVDAVFGVANGVVEDVTVVGTHVVRGIEYPLTVVKEPVKDVVEVVTTPDKDQPCKHKVNKKRCK
jgi:hypothetical protein